MDFEKFCDNIVQFNLENLNKYDELIPKLHMLKNDTELVCPIIAMSRSPMDFVQGLVDVNSPDMYCFVSEAWMKFMPHSQSKEYEKNYHHGDVSKDSQKQECLIFLGKTKDGEQQYYKVFEITRGKNNKKNYREVPATDFESDKLT